MHALLRASLSPSSLPSITWTTRTTSLSSTTKQTTNTKKKFLCAWICSFIHALSGENALHSFKVQILFSTLPIIIALFFFSVLLFILSYFCLFSFHRRFVLRSIHTLFFFYLLYYHVMLCNSVTKHAFSFFLRLYSHIGIVSIFGKKEKKNSLWFHFSSMRTVQCVWENLLNRDVRGLIEHSSLLTLSFVSVYNNTYLKINILVVTIGCLRYYIG